MELGMIGLGRMGANMTQRLLEGGHRVVVSDLDDAALAAAVALGAEGAIDLSDLVQTLAPPRVIWLMLPAGAATEKVLDALAQLVEPGDMLVDGGNSYYQDSERRALVLARRGIALVDVGTSGGIWGLREGYSMTVGGTETAVAAIRPALETLAPAPDRGWGHVGPSGAGHFVKMVHNGIEYGIMQAYAEGYELMAAKSGYDLDLQQITAVWQSGSVIRSWLLDLIALALAEDATLDGIAPFVFDSGEGRWTAIEGIELAVALPVITAALQQRFRSRTEASLGDKLVAALREQFGGHAVLPE